MTLIAKFQGDRGEVITEQVGRYLVDFDSFRMWILKGAEGLEVTEYITGRPRKFSSNSERQRAYRERKAGKALRNYSRSKA